MRFAALLVLGLVFASCSSNEPRGGGGGGSGGAGGSGGTGGTPSEDTEAPVIVVESPASGETTTEASIVVRGTVADTGGVESLSLTVNGLAKNLPADGSTLVEFEQEVELAEGENELRISALDRSGNKANATVLVTRSRELRVWPQRATLVPGARLLIAIEDPYVDRKEIAWTKTGGEWGMDHMYGLGKVFIAGEVGDYVVTGKMEREGETWTARVDIAVRDIEPPVKAYRGIGGQVGTINSWNPSLLVDADGSVMVQAPSGVGLARYRHGEWDFVHGELESVRALVPVVGGAAIAVSSRGVFRREPGSSTFQLLGESTNIRALAVGPDGEVWASTYRSWGVPSDVWTLSQTGTLAQVPMPEGFDTSAIAFAPDGAVAVGGMNGDGGAEVFVREAGSPDWAPTPPLPERLGTLRSLAFDPALGWFVAGSRVARLGAEGWLDEGDGLPTCDSCHVSQLRPSPTLGLLAVGNDALYARNDDGSFAPVGIPCPEMAFTTGGMGMMSSVEELSDGTLYLAGDLGIFRLVPEATSWTLVGDPTLPAGVYVNDIFFEEDGALLLAGSGWSHGATRHPLYRRKAGGTWEGVGAELKSAFVGDYVTRIVAGPAGARYGFDWASRSAFRWDPPSVTGLPYDPHFSFGVTALGVSSDGTVWAVAGTQDALAFLRWKTGDETWTEQTGMRCVPRQIERAPDGALWAVVPCDLVPWVLPAGEKGWRSPDFEGLPSGGVRGLAIDETGKVLVATEGGVFRRTSTGAWERVGYGPPSAGAEWITARGGRIYATVRSTNTPFVLDPATEAWVPMPRTPISTNQMEVFRAGPTGSLFFGSNAVGLIEAPAK